MTLTLAECQQLRHELRQLGLTFGTIFWDGERDIVGEQFANSTSKIPEWELPSTHEGSANEWYFQGHGNDGRQVSDLARRLQGVQNASQMKQFVDSIAADLRLGEALLNAPAIQQAIADTCNRGWTACARILNQTGNRVPAGAQVPTPNRRVR